MPSTTLLVDGDIVIHQACIRCQKEAQWNIGIKSLYSEDSEVMQALDHEMDSMRRGFGATEMHVALSAYPVPEEPSRWREDVLPSYKASRLGMKPLNFWMARSYMMAEYGATFLPRCEGDDLLGIWATGKHKGAIIISIDKDLKTIPGLLSKGVGEPVLTSSLTEANHYHLTQVLTGDRVDNYMGCPGAGPKKAHEILGDPGQLTEVVMWERIVRAYEKAGLGVAEALTQARVAHIMRAEDWDHRGNRVKLWEPPKRTKAKRAPLPVNDEPE